MTAGEPDLFEILGLPDTANLSELKRECQKLLVQLHPDKNGGVASDRLDAVMEAWRILSDPSAFEKFKAEREAAAVQRRPIWRQVDPSDFSRDPEGPSLPCRCGGVFQVAEGDLEEGPLAGYPLEVECDTCSHVVLVVECAEERPP